MVGTYAVVPGLLQNGRPVYKGLGLYAKKAKYIFFNGKVKRWYIGDDYTSNARWAHSHHTACENDVEPQLMKEWVLYNPDTKKWGLDASATIKCIGMCGTHRVSYLFCTAEERTKMTHGACELRMTSFTVLGFCVSMSTNAIFLLYTRQARPSSSSQGKHRKHSGTLQSTGMCRAVLSEQARLSELRRTVWPQVHRRHRRRHSAVDEKKVPRASARDVW